MTTAEYPQTSPPADLVPASGTLPGLAPPPLAALTGPLPAIIAAAERAVREPQASVEETVLGRFLLHHRPATAREYCRDVLAFAAWCWTARGMSVLAADRAAVEVWLHGLQSAGMRART